MGMSKISRMDRLIGVGLVVVLGICMSGALLYAITAQLSSSSGLSLTLSGVIGLIVSVGVTADSCVVYFERLKEEIRSGRTVRTSVERGFNPPPRAPACTSPAPSAQ